MAERQERKYPVNEHFYTWQGEGIHLGKAAYFIRLHGCSVHCTYCLEENSNVLMADGSHKAIKDIKIGEEVLGYGHKTRHGLAPSKVLNVIPTGSRKVLEVVLEDGSNLTLTPDHKVFAGIYQAARGRIVRMPMRGGDIGYIKAEYLREGDYIKGGGRSWMTPEKTDEWRAGYLAGALDGDGHIGEGWIGFASPDFDVVDAVKDAAEFLVTPFNVIKDQVTKPNNVVLRRLRLPEKYRGTLLAEIEWRDDPEFARGYLAGLFDTDGYSGSSYRWSNSVIPYITQSQYNAAKIEKAKKAARLLGYELRQKDFINKEPVTPGAEPRYARLDIPELSAIQLAQLLDMQCLRKRQACMMRGAESTWRKIVSIEEVDEAVNVYDITTESHNFFAEGLLVHNCDSAGTWHKNWVPDSILQVTAEELVAIINTATTGQNPIVVITGGEPGMFDLTPLVKSLRQSGYYVCVETSGAFDLKDSGLLNHVCVSPKHAQHPSLSSWARADELKFIIEKPEDIKFWTDEALFHRLKGRKNGMLKAVWLHPEWSQRSNPDVLAAITETVKYQSHILPYRAGFQVHKLYMADALDPNSDKRLIPLGGNIKKGSSV